MLAYLMSQMSALDVVFPHHQRAVNKRKGHFRFEGIHSLIPQKLVYVIPFKEYTYIYTYNSIDE